METTRNHHPLAIGALGTRPLTSVANVENEAMAIRLHTAKFGEKSRIANRQNISQPRQQVMSVADKA